jgi:hypothetical protein
MTMYKLLLEVFWRVAKDAYRPPEFANEHAIGLYTASGFCVIAIYWAHRQCMFVVLNNAIGVWREG